LYVLVGNRKQIDHKLAINARKRSAEKGYLALIGVIRRRKCRFYLITNALCVKLAMSRNGSLIAKHAHIRAPQMRDEYRNVYMSVCHNTPQSPGLSPFAQNKRPTKKSGKKQLANDIFCLLKLKTVERIDGFLHFYGLFSRAFCPLSYLCTPTMTKSRLLHLNVTGPLFP
jgi:hypothetical protein